MSADAQMAGTAARPTDESIATRPTAGEKLARPMVAVDTVLFAINEGRLQTYLVELRRGPVAGDGRFRADWCEWASCSTMPRGASCMIRPDSAAHTWSSCSPSAIRRAIRARMWCRSRTWR